MTVREMGSRMDSRELAEWMAYARLEPWGEIRADSRAGTIASLLYNIHRGKRKRPLGPADFMPYLKQEQRLGRKSNPRELSKRLRAAFIEFNERRGKK